MKRSWMTIVSALCGTVLVVMPGCPAVESVGDDVADVDQNSDGNLNANSSGVSDIDSNGNATPDTEMSSAGAALFGDMRCGVCHAADGSGDLGPSIRGVSVDTLDGVLRAAASTHTGGKFPDLTDQDLAELAAFLSSASASADNPTDSLGSIHTVDAAGSGILHGSGLTDPFANCTQCHGADLFGQGQAPACWQCHGSIWDAAPDYPPTHTRVEEGFHHAPGLESPVGNCDACHGADLTGTPLIPSCFSCHGAKWLEGDGEDD